MDRLLVLFLIFNHFALPVLCQLMNPSIMIEKEIMAMSRSRVPWILDEMVENCNTMSKEEKTQLRQNSSRCLADREKYIRSTDLLVSIENQCTVFRKGKTQPSCYEPIVEAVRNCYGPNTDYFQLTNALLEFICSRSENTTFVIKNRSFICYDTHEIREYVAQCLEIRYNRDPFERSEICRAFNMAEHCLRNNFLAGCTESKVHDYFNSMFEYLRDSILCDKDGSIRVRPSSPLLPPQDEEGTTITNEVYSMINTTETNYGHNISSTTTEVDSNEQQGSQQSNNVANLRFPSPNITCIMIVAFLMLYF